MDYDLPETCSEKELLPTCIQGRWASFGLIIDDSGQARCVFCGAPASHCDMAYGSTGFKPCVPIDKRSIVWREAVEQQEKRWAWFLKHRPDLHDDA